MIKLLLFPRYLIKLYISKTEIDRLMMVSVFFSTVILAIRIFYTGRLTFVTLEWNVFLAFIPYFITRWLSGKFRAMENKWKFGGIFLVWLFLFLIHFISLPTFFTCRKIIMRRNGSTCCSYYLLPGMVYWPGFYR